MTIVASFKTRTLSATLDSLGTCRVGGLHAQSVFAEKTCAQLDRWTAGTPFGKKSRRVSMSNSAPPRVTSATGPTNALLELWLMTDGASKPARRLCKRFFDQAQLALFA